MALETLTALTGVGATGVNALGGLASILGGSSSSETDRTVSTTGGKKTVDQLQVDQAGIDKAIQDILGGTQGLGSIFSEEQVSGLYNTSVAKQETGDLMAKIAGEIAKLTGKRVTEEETDEEIADRSKQKSESESPFSEPIEDLRESVKGIEDKTKAGAKSIGDAVVGDKATPAGLAAASFLNPILGAGLAVKRYGPGVEDKVKSLGSSIGDKFGW